uniref:Uncharacterized protein n=1 Tax=Sphaerodactylus townsendi TaxID=933632 RepID=A0ACB8F5H1_9SAUR
MFCVLFSVSRSSRRQRLHLKKDKDFYSQTGMQKYRIDSNPQQQEKQRYFKMILCFSLELKQMGETYLNSQMQMWTPQWFSSPPPCMLLSSAPCCSHCLMLNSSLIKASAGQ